ncbi:hypothetical protein TRICI_003065 [Trichomonascus ciferrii]|uniref:Endonuclease/exonuclease/phosphatase domain-containing protein n=1 Tax=Trichomonascus ciferrii TaxID=44093 RepID=A0A642V460_9ASCO|nr:hypothetical protein TRICI_003065 [Trichomonascus ciferrii]
MIEFNIELINTGGQLLSSRSTKQIDLLSQLNRSSSHFFLLSETRKSIATPNSGPGYRKKVNDLLKKWTAITEGGGGLLSTTGQTGILWKSLSSTNIRVEEIPHQHNQKRITDIYIYMDNYKLRLTSVYAPTTDKQVSEKFFPKLIEEFSSNETANTPWAIGGDWNCVLDPSLDQTSHTTVDPPQTLRCLQEFLLRHSLADSYRSFYPKKRAYTNQASASPSKRRLDRLYVNPPLIGMLRKVKIGDRPHPDTHHQYTCVFADKLLESGPGTWKGKNSLLSNKAHCTRIY